MYRYDKVSSAEATKLIAAAVAEAEKIEKQISIAVAGPEGELVSFLRMDGATATSSVIAPNKAYTSARSKKPTREMGENMISNNRPAAFWGDERITGFGGGMPILADGQVIGAIGISGLSEAEDERIASAAIRNVYK